jgi:flagellar basal-body rod modification protein FlgD
MNALVAVRANSTGLLSASPAQRKSAQHDMQSTARTFHLGKMLKSGAAVKQAAESASVFEGDALGRDSFLNLLLTQVQNQDPMEPVSNTEMVAQLAQFSALEQTQQVAEGVRNLNGNIDQLNFINASNLLGREITGIDTEGELIQGEVQHVQLSGSVVMLTVNDRLVSMAGVQAIR